MGIRDLKLLNSTVGKLLDLKSVQFCIFITDSYKDTELDRF